MMPETVTVIATLIGGLGLFLLAMEMMTDGLKLASGQALKSLLANWTSSLPRGIASSFLITAIVQSSSAVTVASLGFVNAGLIRMRQAVGVIYGANIGTTMTAWLVAIIGFKLNIHAVALPLIGIGAFMMMGKGRGRRLGLGRALVGFGLFFIGIDTLREAFDGIVANFDFSTLRLEGILQVLLYLLIGLVMTILTQSSSAAIAMTISAAAADMVGMYAAAAMVIGANVGTTSTAILAAVGATPNAKRLASAQVIFNIATAIVALVLLPGMFYVVQMLEELLTLSPNIAISLALFHTVFNCLGVLLFIPLHDRLVRALERRFVSQSEDLGRPRYLDDTTAATPSLAVNAIGLELQRNAKYIGEAAVDTLSGSTANTLLDQKINAIHQLSSAISLFIVKLERAALSDDVTEQLAKLMRVDQYFMGCATDLSNLLEAREKRRPLIGSELVLALQGYDQRVIAFLSSDVEPDSELFFEQLDNVYHELKNDRDDLKEQLLNAGTRNRISLDEMIAEIDYLAELKLLNEHWYKAVKLLARHAPIAVSESDENQVDIVAETETAVPVAESVGDDTEDTNKPQP